MKKLSLLNKNKSKKSKKKLDSFNIVLCCSIALGILLCFVCYYMTESIEMSISLLIVVAVVCLIVLAFKQGYFKGRKQDDSAIVKCEFLEKLTGKLITGMEFMKSYEISIDELASSPVKDQLLNALKFEQKVGANNRKYIRRYLHLESGDKEFDELINSAYQISKKSDLENFILLKDKYLENNKKASLQEEIFFNYENIISFAVLIGVICLLIGAVL